MALYHKWDVKNGFAFVLQFFSLISDCLGGVEKSLLFSHILYYLSKEFEIENYFLAENVIELLSLDRTAVS